MQIASFKETPLTFMLIITCVVLYLPELVGVDVNFYLAVSSYDAPQVPWTLLTAMFAHGSLDHLAFNMVSLLYMGTLLERIQGTLRFALVYFISGIVGNIAFVVFGEGYAVGASGAIFGLMGATALVFYSKRRDPEARSIFTGLMVMLVLNVVNSFMPGIALEAHFGGLLAGVAVEALILLEARRRRASQEPANDCEGR